MAAWQISSNGAAASISKVGEEGMRKKPLGIGGRDSQLNSKPQCWATKSAHTCVSWSITFHDFRCVMLQSLNMVCAARFTLCTLRTRGRTSKPARTNALKGEHCNPRTKCIGAYGILWLLTPVPPIETAMQHWRKTKLFSRWSRIATDGPREAGVFDESSRKDHPHHPTHCVK